MLKLFIYPLLLSASILMAQTPQSIIDTGNKVSQDLMKHLGSKLKYELKNNGSLAAAKFCNEKAYTLTQEVNLHQIEGISVKRISLKYRSPLNAPNEKETEILNAMQKQLNKGELSPYLVEHENNTYTYYKPLVIKKQACLKCHGDISKNIELSAFMKENYPLDKAINYKMNELRGAIVVEIKP